MHEIETKIVPKQGKLRKNGELAGRKSKNGVFKKKEDEITWKGKRGFRRKSQKRF